MRATLLFIVSILLLAPTVQSQNLVEEFTMTFSSSQYFETLILESGIEYYLKISGTYGIANWTAHRDAAFEISNQQPTGNDAHWLWNGEFGARPYPDVYNDNHIYFYYFTSNGTSQVFEYYDSAYGDNSGSLIFQVWQIAEEDIYGCTDFVACNYNPDATEDDGSCDYTCCPGPGCCNIGMTWNWELGICETSIPTDSNLDGCTDLNDLMDLLGAYGICGQSEFAACGDDIEHEGYDYSTVQIGDQCWFSENCRYLPEVSPSSEGSETDTFYYVYDYQGTNVEEAQETEYYEAYGVLYNWPAVMTEGICPSGWHVPTDGEFTELTDFLGGESVAGGKMKSTSGWNSGGNGSNSSGFTGLPGGSRYSGGFYSLGSSGLWWSASESGSGSWGRELGYNDGVVDRLNFNRYYGFSARCVLD